MDSAEKLKIDARAKQILRDNDRNGYTIPTQGLYPFQWNWDSALVAMAYASFDPQRGWVELETLLKGQWDDGMVPHIIFWQDDAGYFPGQDQWGADKSPSSSGITQPPVAATLLRKLFINSDAQLKERARPIVKALNKWHQWFKTARDPSNRGLVAIIHPWESGRDNLPDWDRPLSHVDTSSVTPYQRRDTQHVDQNMRPQKEDYDRYMALVHFGRSCNWDPAFIAKNSPFWVADVGMNAVLRRAENDLAWVAEALEETEIAKAAKVRAHSLEQGFERLWNQKLNAYVSLDLLRDEMATSRSAGSWLSFYAGAVEPQRAEIMTGQLEHWLSKVQFGVPSFDPEHALFDSIRYWRGPVWAIINWMISDGLRNNGYEKLAQHIQFDTRELISKTGFYEYFCPLTGRGGGGDNFSWTAAMWLSWATPFPNEDDAASLTHPEHEK